MKFWFIAITPKSTMTQYDSSCYGAMVDTDFLKLFLLERLQKQINLRNIYTKNIDMNVAWTRFPDRLA